MTALLVNADDFGLHTSVNSAIANCIHFGSVNSVSVIANGSSPDFDLLRKFKAKNIFIGIHLTWVGEPWLTDKVFIKDWKALAQKIIWGGKKFQTKLLNEGDAQINKLTEQKLQLSHIDSHQHVHHFPVVWQVAKELQTKYAIERMRVAAVKSNSLLRKNLSGFILNQLAKRHKTDCDFFCAGIQHAGSYNINLFSNELKLAAGNNTELIVHPGNNNNLLNQKYADWNFDWEKENAALMNERLLRFIQENNFDFIKRVA